MIRRSVEGIILSTWVPIITVVHTMLSFFAFLFGWSTVLRWSFRKQARSKETAFLAAAVGATFTGFLFPFHGITPAIVIGVISSVVLLLTILARGKFGPSRRNWSIVFTLGLVISEYLLAFVAVAQAFAKDPALHALAPTLKEPPFGATQGVVLVLFVVFSIFALRRVPVDRLAATI